MVLIDRQLIDTAVVPSLKGTPHYLLTAYLEKNNVTPAIISNYSVQWLALW